MLECRQRGTGRTLALVMDARDGDALVVVSGGDRDYVRTMLRDLGRRHDAIELVVLCEDNPFDKLRGRPRDRRVYVDHAAAAVGTGYASRWFAELEEIAVTRFGGLHFYPVEPCDTGRAGWILSSKPAWPGTSEPCDDR